jgi:hypothetical protein
MKILIISSARSGSTSLFKAFQNTLPNHICFCEPFNEFSDPPPTNPYHLNYKNLVVKFLSNQVPVNCYGFFNNLNIYKESINFFIKNTIPNFEKVVLLTRLDDYKSIESFSFASKSENWHDPYKPQTKIPLEDIPVLLDHLMHSKSIIYGLSNILNIPITYYEDLFTGNRDKVKNFLTQSQLEIPNFEKFYSYLDPKNRYRQN